MQPHAPRLQPEGAAPCLSQVQLASFAACSWFGPITRLRAAQCQTTLGRLRLARGAAWSRVPTPVGARKPHLSVVGAGLWAREALGCRRGAAAALWRPRPAETVPTDTGICAFRHLGGGLTKLKQREAAKLALRQVEVLSMPELE